MNQTQSIIIYRNPMEQQFWESGILFPLLVFMVLTVALGAVFMSVVNQYVYRYKALPIVVVTIAAGVAAFLTLNVLPRII